MNSILVEIEYNDTRYLFRCVSFDKDSRGNYRAWLGDESDYHTIIIFKKGAKFVNAVSMSFPSDTKEDFDSEISKAIQEIW